MTAVRAGRTSRISLVMPCRADVEPSDLCRAPSGQGGQAGAANGLASEVGDQEDSRRAVDVLQAAALAAEHGGELSNARWHRPSVLGLGGCYVLEDQGGGGVAAAAGRECARHGDGGQWWFPHWDRCFWSGSSGWGRRSAVGGLAAGPGCLGGVPALVNRADHGARITGRSVP